MTRTVLLFLGLVLLWVLLSGEWHTLVVLLGLASCVGVTALGVKLGVTRDAGLPDDFHWTRLPGFWLWLSLEVIKSNVGVVRQILRPKIDVTPELFEVEAGDLSELGRVFYANSITITPGTVSVNVFDDRIRVHALTREGADSLREGEMYRRVKSLESHGEAA